MAGGGSYFVCVMSHVSHLRLIHSLLIIILLLPPQCALRNLLHTWLLFAVSSVDCYCTYLRYFHSMTVSCPSGLCLSVSLPLVTSQAQLESDVLDPQPGVTAGTHRMFQALGGPDRSPAVPYVVPQQVSRRVPAPLLRQSGSASAILSRQLLVALTAYMEPPLPLVTSQARLESDVLDPQPGVTAGTRRMFQALGGPDRSSVVPSVAR